ncbi:unnamed protein product, partial [Lymnaea stagnalis]
LNTELAAIEGLCQTMDSLNRWFAYAFLAVGIPGNVLSLLAVRTFPPSTGTCLVQILSVANGCLLATQSTFVLLTGWVNTTSAYCQAKTFLTLFTSYFSAWTLVLIIAERYLRLRSLSHNGTSCFTVKRAKIASLLLGTTALLMAAPSAWLTGPSQDTCLGLGRNGRFWTFVEVTLFSVAPSFLLLVLIFLYVVARAQKNQGTWGAAADRDGTAGDKDESEDGVTRMTLPMAVLFPILTLPVVVVILSFYFCYEAITAEDEGYAWFKLIHAVCVHLSQCINAVNILIYVLFSSRFRSGVRDVFRRCCCGRGSR